MTTKIVPEIKQFDQKVQDKYNDLQARHRELTGRQRVVNSQITEVRYNRAALAAEGSEYFAENERLAELRAELEALQDACDFLLGKAENLKRNNTWIRA